MFRQENADNSTLFQDERYDTSTLFTSLEGTILCSALSSLSALASTLTIVIILRSYEFLSSVYHRLILCSSVVNIFFSSAMALNTLPMPKDMLYTQFEGWHIGNQTSCDIQGFVFVSSAAALYSYFASLILYYLCSITFQIRDEIFRKYIEPLLQVLTWAIAMIVAVNGLVNKMYNPSLLKNWCATELLPLWCIAGSEDDTSNIDTTCIRGTFSAQSFVRKFYTFSFVVVALVLLSVILIIYSVYKSSADTIHRVVYTESHDNTSKRQILDTLPEKEQVQLEEEEYDYIACNNVDHSHDNHSQSIHKETTNNVENNPNHETSIHPTTTNTTKVKIEVTNNVENNPNNENPIGSTTTNTTKVILVQVGAYVSSIALFAAGTGVLMPFRTKTDPPPIVLQYFALIATSMFGTINFCIFVGHKVYNLYRVNPPSSIKSLIWKVLTSRIEMVFIFENMEDVLKEERNEELEKMDKFLEKLVNMEDEMEPDGMYPDPIKPPHVITMFHLNANGQEENISVPLPLKDDEPISINDDELVSHNDWSSSFKKNDSSDRGSTSWAGSRNSLMELSMAYDDEILNCDESS